MQKMYQQIGQRAFVTCVDTFRTMDLNKTEIDCIENFTKKFLTGALQTQQVQTQQTRKMMAQDESM